MNYKCTTALSLHLPPEEKDNVRSTNEWYHVIRDYSRGVEKQWKVVVQNFKKMIEMGTLVKTKDGVTQITLKAPKAKAAAKVPQARAAAPKAPAFKKVNYVVSDPNDTRQWKYIKEQFKTEAERDARIAEVKADPNMSFVSKGWGDRQFSVAYWKVVG